MSDRKPKDPDAFKEAQRAAGGDIVEPIFGSEVMPDMVLRHNDRWLPVRFKSGVGDFVRIDFLMDAPGETAFRFTALTTELYRRVPNGAAQ